MSTTEFKTEIDRKIGGQPKDRVYFYPESLEGEATEYIDLTDYYAGLSRISQEKERNRAEIAAGDVQIRMFNTDNYFCDKQSTSLFYGETYYLNRKIELYKGMVLPDGTTEYVKAMTCELIEIEVDVDSKYAYFICQDISKDIIEGNLNVPASNMVPAANSSNTGNGVITDIVTKPFSVVTESWTLTCTTRGGSGEAIFGVVGSVSGNIGNATVGDEFESDSYGVRFTIYAGDTDFEVGDIFTFSTRQYPEYTSENIVDIIEDVLTDTTYGLGIDSSRLNSSSFTTAAANVGIGDVTGYIPFNTNAATFIREMLRLTFGSIWTDENGLINIFIWKPVFGGTSYKEYNRNLKITKFKYKKEMAKLINQITIKYRKQADWAWSNEGQEYDGMYYDEDNTSITRYSKRPYPPDGVLYSWWISENDAGWIASRLLDRYSEPWYIVNFETRLDAIEEFVGNYINVKESDSNFT